MHRYKKIGLPFVLTLAACTHLSLDARHNLAASIAAGAGMKAEIVPAGPFNLTAYERFTQPDVPVHVYIEGDGLAWVSRHEKSLNPTPPDPVALRLAAADDGPNVVWLARPCQYSGMRDGSPCPDTYWTTGRTAPEVIAAYEQALDGLKAAHGITAFELVGYSGGAAVAVLAAAGRGDIASIRTVAGNTDYAAFAAVHHLPPEEGSVAPESVAAKVSGIPQAHFIGAEDKVVPVAVFEGWKQASSSSPCLRADTVKGNTHDKGWTEAWPELLKTPLSCTK